MKAKYIDKTFPITLQDLIDLAKSENKDPKDLKLNMNSNSADLKAYVQCALLNEYPDIYIELYTEANDGLRKDLQLKTNENTNEDPSRFEKAYCILDNIRDLTNLEIHIASDTDIKSLNEAFLILKAFNLKQQ